MAVDAFGGSAASGEGDVDAEMGASASGGRRASTGPPEDSPSGKRRRWTEPGSADMASASRTPSPQAGVAIDAAEGSPASGRSAPQPPASPSIPGLVGGLLTAGDLLVGRVLLRLPLEGQEGSGAWAPLLSPPAADGSVRGGAEGRGAADDFMDVDAGSRLGAGEAAGPRAEPGSRDAGCGSVDVAGCNAAVALPPPLSPPLEVTVVVESGAEYAAQLTRLPEGLAARRSSDGSGITAGGGPGGQAFWELSGLRPYLIRRQAGVGDVLELWPEPAAQAAGPPSGAAAAAPSLPRLCAQLKQRVRGAA
ncbi:hypothetical protein GPECTOR_48g452 [Gonium pectorale]|uniref:Uncharacterized protein n=1 Tax=Gonium pectorale TaxID=33097 RepID=A0A150G840_GONPE|nr:hypothetical protein GPECTOR_48g452 [Gonium pectorale]|eukprot:KXZ46019.1 hypothetical protein GPECTOR_48g452 [Gonium pectorale]